MQRNARSSPEGCDYPANLQNDEPTILGGLADFAAVLIACLVAGYVLSAAIPVGGF